MAIKGTKKLVAIYKDSKTAKNAAEKAGAKVENINTTPIAKEKLLDDLLEKMQKPHVEDKKLSNIANDLYRQDAKIGNGSWGSSKI